MLWILNLASWLSAADATVLQVPSLVRALGCSCPSALLARVAFCLSMVILMLKDEREKTKYYGILSSF
jgi:hypothetical protein